MCLCPSVQEIVTRRSLGLKGQNGERRGSKNTEESDQEKHINVWLHTCPTLGKHASLTYTCTWIQMHNTHTNDNDKCSWEPLRRFVEVLQEVSTSASGAHCLKSLRACQFLPVLYTLPCPQNLNFWHSFTLSFWKLVVFVACVWKRSKKPLK